MSNRLKNESSPYLLQHAQNPVDWYPWGEEAFEKARREDKPVFLSIGYSTCHWCHVMAHESFENDDIADILNQNFISIKVDREERPDVDRVYMAVCQALTGSGGWPMSIFLTPEQKPFYAGTYFPPVSRYGMIGFGDLLLAIVDKWKTQRPHLLKSAEEILSHMQMEEGEIHETMEEQLPKKAAEQFLRSFDKENGGFGQAPKFPTAHNLIFLILYSIIYKDKNALKQATFTLEKMRRGGIFDQIGYGFSRYSTDAYFLVPHFEKMLYDNGLLILAYAAAYKATGEKQFLTTAEQTAEYVLREMTGPLGEFYSAQDADSEGEEGRYYVFRYEEVIRVLGEEKGRRFCDYFGMTKQGNFEGKNIPNLRNGKKISHELEEERKLLYEYRKSRTSLHLDNKVLTAWNSLMICALAILYRVTGKKHYLHAAQKNQEFIEEYLTNENHLYVSCHDQRPSVNGFLDDYAYYVAGLLSLYEVTGESCYQERAEEVMEEAQRQFCDSKGMGYFLYGTENENLITKPKETYDGALPSGNSVMAYCLVRIWQLTGREEDRKRAEKQLIFLSGKAREYPAGHSLFQIALLFYLHPPKKITVVLSRDEKAQNMYPRLPLYADVRILLEPEEGYSLINDQTTYYVCEGHTCFPPSNELPGGKKI